jgi:hypothetical protein
VVSLANELEQRFLPLLEGIAARLRADFPAVRVSVGAHSVGSLTTFQGHLLWVECLLPGVPPHQPDLVSITLGLRHLTTEPLLDVDVGWGHPSGHLETEVFPCPVPVTEAALAEVEAALPQLAEILAAAVRRGHPLK